MACSAAARAPPGDVDYQESHSGKGQRKELRAAKRKLLWISSALEREKKTLKSTWADRKMDLLRACFHRSYLSAQHFWFCQRLNYDQTNWLKGGGSPPDLCRRRVTLSESIASLFAWRNQGKCQRGRQTPSAKPFNFSMKHFWLGFCRPTASSTPPPSHFPPPFPAFSPRVAWMYVETSLLTRWHPQVLQRKAPALRNAGRFRATSLRLFASHCSSADRLSSPLFVSFFRFPCHRLLVSFRREY